MSLSAIQQARAAIRLSLIRIHGGGQAPDVVTTRVRRTDPTTGEVFTRYAAVKPGAPRVYISGVQWRVVGAPRD